MRVRRPILLCLALVLLLPVAGRAQFTLLTNSGAITITGYTGAGGAVIIPAATNGLPVMSIGPSAFGNYSYNSTITSISVPNSITNLGNNAFYDCNALTNINIPGSVTALGSGVCQQCQHLTTVTLGYGLTNISAYMFDQSGMKSLVIPNSVTSIGTFAFAGSSLTNIVMSANLAGIGNQAFNLCYGLRSVYFLGNAPAPGSDIFDGDTSTTAYYLPFTEGWTNTYAGIPAVEWTPAVPALGITMYSNAPVVILPYLAESIGTNFQLQMTTNLASGNWVTVSNVVPFIAVQITNAPSPAYFRVQ
jgi:hypothetical protein